MSIFCGVGLPGFTVAVIVGVVGIISILLGAAIIDKVSTILLSQREHDHLSLQLGRKPILLLGASLMLFSHLVSASLILCYDLEGEEPAGVSQHVAGYFVLVSVCVLVFGAVMSIG